MKNRKNLIISLLILFLLTSILFLTNSFSLVDSMIYNVLMYMKSDNVTKLMKFITFFGSAKFVICFIIILLLISIIKYKKTIIFVLIIIGETFLNSGIKYIFKRERPTILQMVEEKSYSFPSGHTMVSIVLYGFIIYLINKSGLNKKIKIAISIIIGLIPILIMISRIYLGVHYFSDVLGGLFLALAYLLSVIEIIERKNLL